jgi:hypothetical protein
VGRSRPLKVRWNHHASGRGPTIICGRCARVFGEIVAEAIFSIREPEYISDPEGRESFPYRLADRAPGTIRRDVTVLPPLAGRPWRFHCGKCGARSYLDALPRGARDDRVSTRMS